MPDSLYYESALYYPYLHFNHPNWIKTAALYYNNIKRIVPSGFMPSDSRTVKSLIDHFNFVQDVDPQNAARDIAPDFMNFVRENLADPYKREEMMEKLEGQLNDKDIFEIHTGKTGNALGQEM